MVVETLMLEHFGIHHEGQKPSPSLGRQCTKGKLSKSTFNHNVGSGQVHYHFDWNHHVGMAVIETHFKWLMRF